MSKVTISMPEAMSDYVVRRVRDGQYGNVSEFFRDLVRRDQEARGLDIEELRAKLEEGFSSGISSRSVEDIVSDVKARLRADGQL